jgi:hypothetical protein
MRFLVRLVPLNSDRATALPSVRDVAASLGARAVNPKWTSQGVLEIDLFVSSRLDFEVLVAALAPVGKVVLKKDLRGPPPFLSREQAVQEWVGLFNSERFWEAHEVLESVWRVAEGDEKKLLQGLILLCAAFVHGQKGEEEVALGILRRALPLLVWSHRTYYEVEVAGIRERVGRMVAEGSLSVFAVSRRPAG